MLTTKTTKNKLSQAEFEALIQANPNITTFPHHKEDHSDTQWDIKYSASDNKTEIHTTISLQNTLRQMNGKWYWIRFDENPEYGNSGIVKEIALFAADVEPNFVDIKKKFSMHHLLKIYEKTQDEAYLKAYDKKIEALRAQGLSEAEINAEINAEIKQEVVHELEILQILGIESFFSERVNKNNETVYELVMPMAPGKRLTEILDSHVNEIQMYEKQKQTNPNARAFKGPYTFAEALSYGKSLLSRMFEYKEKEIIHGDIKPDNIVAKNGEISLIDHGFSQKASAKDKGQCGTDFYVAPEISYEEKEISYLSDAFSGGMVLFEIFCSADFIFNKANLLRPLTLMDPMDYFYQNFYEGKNIMTFLSHQDFIKCLKRYFPNDVNFIEENKNNCIKDLYDALVQVTHPNPKKRQLRNAFSAINNVANKYEFYQKHDPLKFYIMQQLKDAFAHDPNLAHKAEFKMKEQKLQARSGNLEPFSEKLNEKKIKTRTMKVVTNESCAHYYAQSSRRIKELLHLNATVITEKSPHHAKVQKKLEAAYNVALMMDKKVHYGRELKCGAPEKLLQGDNWHKKRKIGWLFFTSRLSRKPEKSTL